MAKQFFVLGIGGTGMRCIESLIRKFGEAWYAELENVAEELEKQHII